MLRPYFSLENVRSGIFFLANRLYGITFRPVNVPLYNEECSAFEVLDADSSHLGVLYFDLFPRAGKGAGPGAAISGRRATATASGSIRWWESSATSRGWRARPPRC